jgi:hypothetical protein
VADNGPQFISAEFGNFASKWEFSHTTSSPYHQQANEKSEANVKIVKRMYRKCKDSEEDFWKTLLFRRNTPNKIGTSQNRRILGRVKHGFIPISTPEDATQN